MLSQIICYLRLIYATFLRQEKGASPSVAEVWTYAPFTIISLALSQYGATMAPMKAARKDSRSSALERINLRLPPEVLEAIDSECSRRAGSVSRNTWITEAVTERLARLASSSRPQGAGGANG